MFFGLREHVSKDHRQSAKGSQTRSGGEVESLHGNFETEVATSPAEDTAAGTFRLRGKSFFLSYNWDFFGKPLPDGTPASRDSAELWRLWQTWEEDRVKSLRVNENSSTLERSLHSNTPDRVHFHWKVNLKDSVDQVGTAGFQFHGVKPGVRATTVALRSDTQKARGASFQEASDRAHFYVCAPKKETLFSAASYKPWENYKVLGKWLDDL